jgi:hypothetical protein
MGRTIKSYQNAANPQNGAINPRWRVELLNGMAQANQAPELQRHWGAAGGTVRRTEGELGIFTARFRILWIPMRILQMNHSALSQLYSGAFL